MNLKIRQNPKLSCLTLEQLQEIVANLSVDIKCDVRPVSYSPVPPANTQLPWAQTDSCSGEPLGRLKQFKNGECV